MSSEIQWLCLQTQRRALSNLIEHRLRTLKTQRQILAAMLVLSVAMLAFLIYFDGDRQDIIVTCVVTNPLIVFVATRLFSEQRKLFDYCRAFVMLHCNYAENNFPGLPVSISFLSELGVDYENLYQPTPEQLAERFNRATLKASQFAHAYSVFLRDGPGMCR